MPVTAEQQVRILSGLTVEELPDLTLESLLELNAEAPKLAAADALEIVASQLTTVTVASDDISLDGSKRANALLARAARLREQHEANLAGEGFFFEVVDTGSTRPELTERPAW